MNTPADYIRDFIVGYVLTDYLPAIFLDESVSPFNSETSKICYVRQEGRGIESFTRQHDCQVWLYTHTNASPPDIQAVRDDAELAASTIFNTPNINNKIANSLIIEDVTGPYRTNTNRYFYRFTFRVISEF